MVLNGTIRVTLALLIALTAAGGIVSAAVQEGAPTRDSWPTEEWPTASPEEQGMDPDLLEEADRRMRTEWPRLSALLVVRGGDLVVEEYYGGHEPDQPIHTWSVTKSLTNTAVGIALEEGLITDLDQTLGELIPERIPAGADPRVNDVTLRHLLTMTAGWAWDSTINFSRAAETDDLDLVLTRPMACDPGTCFEYDSGSSNLLSYIIQELADETMAEYLQPRLFDPLGIADPEWVTTEDGATRGSGGLFLTPRDMAKIGYLYLNHGWWDGEQIISEEWVHSSTSEQSSGISALNGVNIGGGPYGYHWWAAEVANRPAFTALGYGGQMVYVVPDLDLVVVTAVAGSDAAAPDLQQRPRPIIEELIVPAALGEQYNSG